MKDSNGNIRFDAPIVKVQAVMIRAGKMGIAPKDRMSCFMDIEAANVGTPLDFDKWLAFPDFDFAHDFNGIRAHIDRTSGDIADCFLPRCAK
jgi:hypothetical protein